MTCSLKDKILQKDRLVPRYTSYPTAPHFKPDFEDGTYRDWLESLPAGTPLSLYIHVPFCPKLCWYCGCNTKITQRYAPVEDYLHLLIREITLLRGALGRGRPAHNIHFGGGSPGMLRPRDFALLMRALRDTFDIAPDAEIAIEMDPREITEGRIATYAKHSVTRASLGVQDFDERVLAAINRPQPFALTYDAVKMLRDYGITGINFDLLYGLPHQDVLSMTETIEKTILLEPARVALFGYAHVPWMKKHMRLINEDALPRKELRYDLFETGAELLRKAGYQHVGIDHFARPGDPLLSAYREKRLHRNFQGYTTDDSPALIGLGASAIGRLPQGFVQNAPDLPLYRGHVLAGRLPVEKSCALSAEDRLRAAVIEQIMCYMQADIPALCAAHGFEPGALNAEIVSLMPWREEDLLQITPAGKIMIAPGAHAMARLVCTAFDAHINAKAEESPRHARAI